MFFGSEAPVEQRKQQPLNHKDYKHCHVAVKRSLEMSHLWHWRTPPWPEEACSVAAAQLCPFWWTWHFLLYGIHQTRSVSVVQLRAFIATMQRCITLIQFLKAHTRWSGVVRNSNSKGYDSVKVRSTPIQDLLESGAMLASCLALSNKSRVGSKQNPFWGSCVSILYLTGHRKTKKKVWTAII